MGDRKDVDRVATKGASYRRSITAPAPKDGGAPGFAFYLRQKNAKGTGRVRWGLGSNPGEDMDACKCSSFAVWRYSKQPSSRKSSREVGGRGGEVEGL
ncbi:hypothetical protein TNCV_5116851 [Trichonephila clavipes]|nr:hypothetical protein TNCV_5116851 [Trichonephila clavipes]